MNRGRELLVGFVILSALAVGVVGTYYLQGTNFGQPQVARDILVRTVGQLNRGNSVKYLGVNIGRIEAFGVIGTAVRVSMLLDEDVVLPGDAAVILGPESMFGDWQAEIVSMAEYPRYAFYQLPVDAPPGVLPGYALPEMSRLTASAEQIADNLAQLSDRLELAFNEETATQLASAISNLEAISLEIRELVVQQAAVATSVSASADAALNEVEEASRVARRSFERIEGILSDSQIDTIVANMRVASAGIQAIATDLSEATGGISGTVDRADSAFARIDRIAARIEDGEGAVGRLLSDSTLAIRAEDVLDQLALLLKDVRENPRRYVRLSIF
ncbi:MAG: hypothetical protein O2992_02815 [Gemmatimonadetes bacterium]|nr:hypothetical protein [Gemmatimonadota bacterium]